MTELPDSAYNEKWFEKGYQEGRQFAQYEAEYDELASIYRSKGIPVNWDIFRAETLNRYLGDKTFDFASYAAGFAKACVEFFEKI
jgi:hypothetical protein